MLNIRNRYSLCSVNNNFYSSISYYTNSFITLSRKGFKYLVFFNIYATQCISLNIFLPFFLHLTEIKTK